MKKIVTVLFILVISILWFGCTSLNPARAPEGRTPACMDNNLVTLKFLADFRILATNTDKLSQDMGVSSLSFTGMAQGAGTQMVECIFANESEANLEFKKDITLEMSRLGTGRDSFAVLDASNKIQLSCSEKGLAENAQLNWGAETLPIINAAMKNVFELISDACVARKSDSTIFL